MAAAQPSTGGAKSLAPEALLPAARACCSAPAAALRVMAASAAAALLPYGSHTQALQQLLADLPDAPPAGSFAEVQPR